jgi:hypothetical protein
MTSTDQPRSSIGTFDTKGQSAPDTAVTLTESPLRRFTIHFAIEGTHTEVVEAATLEEAIELASNEANEHSGDVSYELNFTGSSVE